MLCTQVEKDTWTLHFISNFGAVDTPNSKTTVAIAFKKYVAIWYQFKFGKKITSKIRS